jgi:hypothetical protein
MDDCLNFEFVNLVAFLMLNLINDIEKSTKHILVIYLQV